MNIQKIGIAATAAFLFFASAQTGWAQEIWCEGEGYALVEEEYLCVSFNDAEGVGVSGVLLNAITATLQDSPGYDVRGVVMALNQITGGTPNFQLIIPPTTTSRTYVLGGSAPIQYCGNDICKNAQGSGPDFTCGAGDSAGYDACESIKQTNEMVQSCTLSATTFGLVYPQTPGISVMCSQYVNSIGYIPSCSREIYCNFSQEPTPALPSTIEAMCESTSFSWNEYSFLAEDCNNCSYTVMNNSAHRWSCSRVALSPEVSSSSHTLSQLMSDSQGFLCDRFEQYLEQYDMSMQQGISGIVTATFIPNTPGFPRQVVQGAVNAVLCAN